MMVGLVTVGCLLPRRAVGFLQVCRRWFFGLAASLRPTPRAADTASPWASRGGWSGEVASPAVVVGRHRRAADAIVRPVVVEAEVVGGKSEPGRCGFRAQAAARKSKGAKRPAASRVGWRAG